MLSVSFVKAWRRMATSKIVEVLTSVKGKIKQSKSVMSFLYLNERTYLGRGSGEPSAHLSARENIWKTISVSLSSVGQMLPVTSVEKRRRVTASRRWSRRRSSERSLSREARSNTAAGYDPSVNEGTYLFRCTGSWEQSGHLCFMTSRFLRKGCSPNEGKGRYGAVG